MLTRAKQVIITLLLCSTPAIVWADTASDIQALKDAKALLDAQAAKDTAEATAIKAAGDLAKAKATAANVATEVQKNQLDAAAALTKSQVGAETAQIDSLKSTFGPPPTIGGDGNITISDAGSGMLLQIKAGSLKATCLLAENFCTALQKAEIKDAFFAPSDLDTKIQSARMVLREFNALSKKVSEPKNKALVGLDGAQAQFGPAAALGAISLLQYGAGAMQTIAKLFKSDYTVGLTSDAARAAWLEYFMAAKCPNIVPYVQLEAAVRNQSIDTVLVQLNEMLDFYNAATITKSTTQKRIELLTAKITSLKAEKKDTKIFQEQLDEQLKKMELLVTLDVWLPRIQALITSVSTNPGPFLDALTWNAFGDDTNQLKISARPRLTVILTTQDGQIIKSFWLTGKDVYGHSAGELIYRVLNPDGKVLATGYLTTTISTGNVLFKNKDMAVTDSNHLSTQKPTPQSNP